MFSLLYIASSSFTGGGGSLVTKSCLTLATPWIIAHQVPLSSVHGISQARILEWVAISFFIFWRGRCP